MAEVMKMITQRTGRTAMATSAYDNMPVSRVLFRYWWPFWLLKDANRGDRYARAAAYRHNRNMRIYLPGYLVRWMLGSASVLVIMAGFESVSTQSAGLIDAFSLMTAGLGVVFACSVCVLFVTGYIYLYLGNSETDP